MMYFFDRIFNWYLNQVSQRYQISLLFRRRQVCQYTYFVNFPKNCKGDNARASPE